MDQLSKLLRKMRELEASDLILCPGTPPAFRVHGSLIPRSEEKALSSSQIEAMSHLIMLNDQLEIFQQEHEINLAISLPELGRFRINVYLQRREMSMAIRAIPKAIPTFKELRLPEELKDIVKMKNGLIIITGAAGSGKSTSMATMINHRNKNEYGHIITIEEPMEYDIPHDKSVVSQREIGADTNSYEKALLNVVRQSPDVLMIGEIRERKTLEQALEFSETGHLCLTTLHANNTTQTFERIQNMFMDHEREQVLNTLASSIRAVLSQRLLPDTNGKLVLAYELLLPTPRTVDLIRRGEFWELRDNLEKNNETGMQSMDQTLYDLFKEKRISLDTAIQNATSENNLRLKIKLEKSHASGKRASG